MKQNLYVIGEGTGSGVVKIGKSADVQSRLTSLQTGCPVRLQILHVESDAGELESWLHDQFAQYRQHGEWFNFGANDPVATVRVAIERHRLSRSIEQVTEQLRAEFEEKLKEREQYWQDEVAELQSQMAEREALFAKEREFQELANYAARRANEVIPLISNALMEQIGGNSKEEIDASIAVIMTRAMIAPSDNPTSLQDVLNDVDPRLFKYLVDQAFVPRMPARRITPELASA